MYQRLLGWLTVEQQNSTLVAGEQHTIIEIWIYLTRATEVYHGKKKESAKITGQRLKEIRAKRKVTQCKVAVTLNMTVQMMSRYENGVTDPPVEALLSLARYYRIDPNYLLGWDATNDTRQPGKALSEAEFLTILEAHGKMIYQELTK